MQMLPVTLHQSTGLGNIEKITNCALIELFPGGRGVIMRPDGTFQEISINQITGQIQSPSGIVTPGKRF